MNWRCCILRSEERHALYVISTLDLMYVWTADRQVGCHRGECNVGSCTQLWQWTCSPPCASRPEPARVLCMAISLFGKLVQWWSPAVYTVETLPKHYYMYVYSVHHCSCIANGATTNRFPTREQEGHSLLLACADLLLGGYLAEAEWPSGAIMWGGLTMQLVVQLPMFVCSGQDRAKLLLLLLLVVDYAAVAGTKWISFSALFVVF